MAFSKMLPASGHEAWQTSKDTELWYMVRLECSHDGYFSTLETEKLLEREGTHKGRTDFFFDQGGDRLLPMKIKKVMQDYLN